MAGKIESGKVARGTVAERAAAIVSQTAADFTAAPNRKTLATARRKYREFRAAEFDFSSAGKLLTSPSEQPKTGKNAIPTFTLMLVPATGAGNGINLCPHASNGCISACLATSGKGKMDRTQFSRLCKTRFLLEFPEEFGIILAGEILSALAKFDGKIGFRPNCLSDIRWEINPAMILAFDAIGVAVYDYTAAPPKWRNIDGLPYHLTHSAKETHSVDYIRRIVESGRNIAVPFAISRNKPMISEWHGMPVIDGDVTDFRPSDPSGVIVGLREKVGKNGKDSSGFVRSAVLM